MTIELNAERLAELGFRGLTKEQTNTLLREMYRAGEEIVGLKFASKMSEEQLEAFERILHEENDDAIFNWLKANFPEYREIAETTFEELDVALHAAVKSVRGDDDVYTLESRDED